MLPSIAEKSAETVRTAAKIDTRHLRLHQHLCLNHLALTAELLEAARPKFFHGEVEEAEEKGKNGLALVNARFKTRVRRSNTVSRESLHIR